MERLERTCSAGTVPVARACANNFSTRMFVFVIVKTDDSLTAWRPKESSRSSVVHPLTVLLTSNPQYREKFMVSPAPIVRPVFGDWAVDGLLDGVPPRPPPATEQLRKILDFYLHSMVFHKDRLGRPVRAPAQS